MKVLIETLRTKHLIGVKLNTKYQFTIYTINTSTVTGMKSIVTMLWKPSNCPMLPGPQEIETSTLKQLPSGSRPINCSQFVLNYSSPRLFIVLIPIVRWVRSSANVITTIGNRFKVVPCDTMGSFIRGRKVRCPLHLFQIGPLLSGCWMCETV